MYNGLTRIEVWIVLQVGKNVLPWKLQPDREPMEVKGIFLLLSLGLRLGSKYTKFQDESIIASGS